MSEKYESLPKKRMAAGALFRNGSGQYLLVKPHYKNHWDIPGGVVEENESPLEGCRREITEEVGLCLKQTRLLCLDYKAKSEDAAEGLIFIFDGGALDNDAISKIRLQEDELTDFAFVPLEKAGSYLNERMHRRVRMCDEAIKREAFYYTEDQRIS